MPSSRGSRASREHSLNSEKGHSAVENHSIHLYEEHPLLPRQSQLDDGRGEAATKTPTVVTKAVGVLFGNDIRNAPHGPALLGSLLAGLLCASLAVVGLAMFHSAVWFHDPGPFASNSWCGYDKYNFVGLVFFTFLTTIGFNLMYVPLTVASRYRRSKVMIVFLGGFSFLCFAMGLVGVATWGSGIMKCLGIFCVGPPGSFVIDEPQPHSGLGFLSIIGNAAFFSLFPISLVLFHQLYVRIFVPLDAETSRWTPPADDAHTVAGTAKWTRHVLVVLICFCLVVLFTGTLYIPNSFEYFTAAQIASNARIHQSMDFDLCNNEWQSYTCGELPWATFITTNWRVGENLVLKIYHANLFFYVYLMLMLVSAYCLRMSRAGRFWLKRSYTVPFIEVSFTFGETIFSLCTIVMLFLFSWYWFHDHNFNGSYVGGNTSGLAKSEHYARALGQLAVIFLSLLLFPASRNSVLHKLLGTSWEASLWAHKVLGWGMLLASLAHMLAWWVKYHQVGIFPKAVMSIPTALPESIDNFTVPITTLAFWVLLVSTVGFAAYEGVRRRYFELFYYAHIYAAYLIIPVTLWHAAAGWEYLLPGVTVWFMDRLIRMYRSGCEVSIVKVAIHEGVTEIRFAMPSMKVHAGQYVFINVPELALFEWHPFTLSSGVGSQHFSVHVKAMDDGSWTARLYNYVRTMEKQGRNVEASLTLAVDGPYGHALEFNDYSRVLLLTGGIGVTPAASIFMSLKRLPHIEVRSYWTLREASLVTAFQDQFEITSDVKADGSYGKSAHVFLTGTTTPARVIEDLQRQVVGCQVQCGRPELEVLCDGDGVDQAVNSSTLVFVCGPIPLVDRARLLASDNGYHFHAETFFL